MSLLCKSLLLADFLSYIMQRHSYVIILLSTLVIAGVSPLSYNSPPVAGAYDITLLITLVIAGISPSVVRRPSGGGSSGLVPAAVAEGGAADGDVQEQQCCDAVHRESGDSCG